MAYCSSRDRARSICRRPRPADRLPGADYRPPATDYRIAWLLAPSLPAPSLPDLENFRAASSLSNSENHGATTPFGSVQAQRAPWISRSAPLSIKCGSLWAVVRKVRQAAIGSPAIRLPHRRPQLWPGYSPGPIPQALIPGLDVPGCVKGPVNPNFSEKLVNRFRAGPFQSARGHESGAKRPAFPRLKLAAPRWP